MAAITDAEGKGDEPTRLAVRAAQAARGIAYGALGVQALRQVGGEDGGSSQGEAARQWTGRLLDMPFGRALVVGVGLGLLGYAGYQLYRAFSDKARKHLDLGEAGHTQATWIVRLGRFGIAARAVVFAMIGVFLGRAGMQRDSGEAGGIAQALQALGDAEHGGLVLAAVSFGLIAYGVYQLATITDHRSRRQSFGAPAVLSPLPPANIFPAGSRHRSSRVRGFGRASTLTLRRPWKATPSPTSRRSTTRSWPSTSWPCSAWASRSSA